MNEQRVARELVRLAKELTGDELEGDCYVYLKVGRYSVEVVVTGIDNRMIWSAHAYLVGAAEDAGASIDDDHPNFTPPDRDWGYMGFTADDEPEYIRDLVRALTKEARGISWVAGVKVGKGKWAS